MNGALTTLGPGGNPEIAGLTADSRRVKPGFLFAALPGTKIDGQRFIPDAVARGAAAILTGSRPQEPVPEHVALLVDPNPRRRLALLAARFHGPQPGTVAAVTGTAGKTSVADFTRQLWERLDQPAASLGTLGIIAPGMAQYGSLTTPDPIALHEALADLAGRGIDHVALEASSHGLDQYRLDGVRIAAAAFTNLSHDHLDYHPSKAAYLAAKARLFDEVMPPGGTAVLNLDAPEYQPLAAICRRRGHRILGFGRGSEAVLRAIATTPEGAGQAARIRVMGRDHTVALKLMGSFQLANVLAALGLVIATGADPERAVAALAGLRGVPGRLEHAASHPNGASIFVDYAHKPEALQTVLEALRPFCRGRLAVVFGCGGDRDAAKRPMMGAIAERLADRVIVTDDNPRSEDPAAIRRAILAASPKAREIGDRGEAIRAAVAELGPADLLVIAGKGHEHGQIVGPTVLPFDDAEAARAAVAAVAARGG
jgi:UDP-N-acetylmuramoyl-L-alanyl-D-glutamate--2,6-diaminopimelate ligase